MIDTKDTFKLDTKKFEEVIEDAMKPDSIVNIQNKYNLDFPFTVKQVKPSFFTRTGKENPNSIGRIITVTGYYKSTGNCLRVGTHDKTNMNAEVKKFILWE